MRQLAGRTLLEEMAASLGLKAFDYRLSSGFSDSPMGMVRMEEMTFGAVGEFTPMDESDDPDLDASCTLWAVGADSNWAQRLTFGAVYARVSLEARAARPRVIVTGGLDVSIGDLEFRLLGVIGDVGDARSVEITVEGEVAQIRPTGADRFFCVPLLVPAVGDEYKVALVTPTESL